MTGFSASSAVFRWIEGFINHERGNGSFRDFRLERMEILAELAGRPERCCPAVHVAGSKGKGSVTAMIASILEASGRRTARYASPHVSDYRERVSGGRGFFSEELYAGAGDELAAAVEALGRLPGGERGRFSGGRAEGEGPTFFELMTLYFFLCARRAGVEAMAVETGLGGRLDATNILEPLVSAITLIEREHTEYLGDSLGAIAGEKAGIIKPGRPLVLAAQGGEALGVFRERAAALGSPLLYLPETAEVRDIRVDREGTVFTLDFWGKAGGGKIFRDLRVPVPGEVQAHNGALAALAALTAFPDTGEGAIRRGLGEFRLPGRFERIRASPAWIIDGAHTPASVEGCVKTFTGLYGEGGILLFGCASGKDAAAMAKVLAPGFSHIIITAPGTFKKSDPRGVYEVFAALKGPELSLLADTAEAVGRALDLSRERGLPVLGTGSFYLAGEIRAALGVQS